MQKCTCYIQSTLSRNQFEICHPIQLWRDKSTFWFLKLLSRSYKWLYGKVYSSFIFWSLGGVVIACLSAEKRHLNLTHYWDLLLESRSALKNENFEFWNIALKCSRGLRSEKHFQSCYKSCFISLKNGYWNVAFWSDIFLVCSLKTVKDDRVRPHLASGLLQTCRGSD